MKSKKQKVVPVVLDRIVREIEALPTCARLVSDNGSHIAYFTNKDFANEASELLSQYWKYNLGNVTGPFQYGTGVKYWEVNF